MTETHFGYETVDLAQKQEHVDAVFHKVAERYDLMNDLMSAGLHRAWKSAFVTRLNPPRDDRPFQLLDVAGGTGDIAFRAIEAGGSGIHATILDVNASMLGVGRERAERRGLTEKLTFVEANAEALPFEGNSFDAYTIAFGIRNVPRIDAALKEAHRVLKRGGHFLCLEFSTIDLPMLDALYERYSFAMIPQMGRLVTGEAQPYQYLVESIRKFPKPDAFAAMIRNAGFANVTHTPFTGNVAAVHSGWKI